MNHLATTRFVILAAPRSGSNMLCSMLDSHPDILCHHELFNPTGIFYALPLRDSDFQLARNMQERDQDPLRFLAKVWQQHASKSCIGFKMTYQQNLAAFNSVLVAPEIKKIVLRRKNTVKSYVSKLIAEQSGIWEDYGDTRPNDDIQVELDLNHLQQDQAFNQRYYTHIEHRLQQTQQNCLHLEYEQLSDSACQRQLLTYLACRYLPLHTRSRKQNPSDLGQKVKNYRQILEQCRDKEILVQLTDLHA
ncbi:sulfotransferase [Undibacterium sp. Ji50W]|uniref:sulfotransferase n=1 Tax=Undibacterium sp. Ji50W TaxID=3413041 RepID=UPI003BF0E850